MIHSGRIKEGMGGDLLPTTYRRPPHYNSYSSVIPPLNGE